MTQDSLVKKRGVRIFFIISLELNVELPIFSPYYTLTLIELLNQIYPGSSVHYIPRQVKDGILEFSYSRFTIKRLYGYNEFN